MFVLEDCPVVTYLLFGRVKQQETTLMGFAEAARHAHRCVTEVKIYFLLK